MTWAEHLPIPFGGAWCCCGEEFILRMQFSGAWPGCEPFLSSLSFSFLLSPEQYTGSECWRGSRGLGNPWKPDPAGIVPGVRLGAVQGLCVPPSRGAAEWAREGLAAGQGSRRESGDTGVPMCSTAETSPPRRQMKSELFSTITAAGAAMAYPGILMPGEATVTSPSCSSGKGRWQHKRSSKQGSVRAWKAAQGLCQACWGSSSAEGGKTKASFWN